MADESGLRTSPAVVERWSARVRSMLPTGGQLPDDIWRVRHIGVVALLWVHAFVIPIFALIRGFPVAHALAESSVIPALALLSTTSALSRRMRTSIASVGLLTCSAVLVHLSGGLIEMHFHFFVMVAVVALYQDWIPFLAAVGYVFVHHGFMGWLAPDSVFNHPAARRHPWLWASVHAFFISGISAACLVAWRLNERTLAERRRAEERLREESQVVESLHEVGKALAADLDGQHVVQTVTDRATELTGAAFGAFFYNVVDDHSGESYVLYTLSGAPREAFSRFGLPRNTPIFAPTFRGEKPVRLDDVTADARYGQMTPHHGMPAGHLPVRSYLAVPVRSRRGEVLGGLFFGHPEPGRFSEASERVATGIASQAAIALDNARLFESERASRAVAEAASQRLTVLAEASRILGASLDPEVVLAAVGALVERLGAACCIDLLTDENVLQRLVSGAVSSDHAAARRAAPSLSDFEDPVVEAMRTQQSVVVEHEGRDQPFALVAPLSGREGVMGAITVFPALPEPGALALVDRAFVEELARRVALALENARLFARQRSVAGILQHSLLPERLPELPGISAASRYLAGGPGVDVGGDWYDVVQLSAGRLAVVIGDVVGRGERAASLMGQLRNALRAYALDGKEPVDTVNNLNMLLLDAGRDRMATMVLAVLDLESGDLTYVNAGHPPPLVAHPSGRSYFLERASGPPLGAIAGTNYRVGTATLAPGDTLLLYTDGLVEERSSPIDAGLERLRLAVSSGPSETDALCAHVVSRLSAGAASHDDTALLAVRLEVLGPHLRIRLPGDPNVMGPLRATLRRWLAPVTTEEERFDLLLAVGEACTNSIRHGLSSEGGHFDFEAELDSEVRITIRDDGGWKQPRATSGGRGLGIIRSCVDDLHIDTGAAGTELRMRRRLQRAPERVGA